MDQICSYVDGHHELSCTLLDVRRPDEYVQGHLPGALLLALAELFVRMTKIPLEQGA